MITPILETDRLILRPFELSDIQAVFECWESDPSVAKYMFWSSHNDINKTKEWITSEIQKISSDEWYRWAVIEKRTNNLIGTGLIYLEHEYNLYEIAYNFGKEYWGNGFATETMSAILQYAKNTLGIKELVGRYAKENIASGNVLKKLGFSFIKDIPYKVNEGRTQYQGIECSLTF